MLYSEFIERTKFGEKYITNEMYTKFIEPAYMNAPENITKDIFCKDFYKLHKQAVSNIVSGLIAKKSIECLVEFIESEVYFVDVEEKHKILLDIFLQAFEGIAKNYYRK